MTAIIRRTAQNIHVVPANWKRVGTEMWRARTPVPGLFCYLSPRPLIVNGRRIFFEPHLVGFSLQYLVEFGRDYIVL